MWDEGYISEVDYVHGYFVEMAPVRLKLALLARGIHTGLPVNPRYLELGFGQGLTLAINAATNSGEFSGTDFNPAQAANARDLVETSGKLVSIFEDSFEQLAARDGLGKFHIIALHGIWSWVSPNARDAIVEIARSRLLAGGILYISYNAMPGWAPTIALRHLLAEHSARAGTGGVLSRVDQSLDFAQKLISAEAAYFTANPGIAPRLSQMKTQDRRYLSHEYFNRNWQPMSFIEVSEALYEAKLTFAASANIADNIPSLANTPAAAELLDGIADASLREMTRDYMLNQQFRRDIFVRGVRPLTRTELLEEIRKQPFLLIGDPDERPTRVSGGSGEAELRQDIYGPIVDHILRQPDLPFTIASLLDEIQGGSRDEWQMWEALLILVASNFIAPIGESSTIEEDRAASIKINAEICRRALFSNHIQYLAAPRIGSAVAVSRIEQLFLVGLEAGEDLVAYVQHILRKQGDHIVSEGQPVTDEAAERAIIADLLAKFGTVRLPMLERVGAVPSGSRLPNLVAAQAGSTFRISQAG